MPRLSKADTERARANRREASAEANRRLAQNAEGGHATARKRQRNRQVTGERSYRASDHFDYDAAIVRLRAILDERDRTR